MTSSLCRLQTQSRRHPVYFGLREHSGSIFLFSKLFFTWNTANHSTAVWYPLLWHNKWALQQRASLWIDLLMLRTTSYVSPERDTETPWILSKWTVHKGRLPQCNILPETVKEGLWGIGSQDSETCNSVDSSLYIKSHWSRTKEQLQIRSTKTPLWGASERINEHWYTFT